MGISLMSATAPIGSSERIGELDVLRGFALFGVFVIHFTGSAFYDLPIGDAQQQAFRESTANNFALFAVEWLIYDKFNTLFAMLFGAGFWVMMERLEQRGENFNRIYLRRLAALFAIGAINLALFFPGDVLHEYAAIGAVLFLMRKAPLAAFVVVGLLLSLFGEPIGMHVVPQVSEAYEAFDTIRDEAFNQGEYWPWVVAMTEGHVWREILRGTLLGWALYILGRFLLGAWIIRKGWIQRVGELLPQIGKLAAVALPAGLALELLSMASYMKWLAMPRMVEGTVHLFGALVLAVGYGAALIVLFHSRGRAIAQFFAPVGKVALTAYVLHGIVFLLLYYPFGLAQAGVLPPIAALGVGIGVFVAMTLAAKLWLTRYAYGPLEYLWRWATYGKRPKFTLAPAPVAA